MIREIAGRFCFAGADVGCYTAWSASRWLLSRGRLCVIAGNESGERRRLWMVLEMCNDSRQSGQEADKETGCPSDL